VEEGQLFFNGEELDLDTTFDDNGIEDGATISFIREREFTRRMKYEVGTYYRFVEYPRNTVVWKDKKDYVDLTHKYQITRITPKRVYYAVGVMREDNSWGYADLGYDTRRIMDDDGGYEYTYNLPSSHLLIQVDELDLWKGEKKDFVNK